MLNVNDDTAGWMVKLVKDFTYYKQLQAGKKTVRRITNLVLALSWTDKFRRMVTEVNWP